MTDTTMNASNAEASFALPSKLDLPDLSRDHDNSDSARDLLKVSSIDVDSLNFNFQDDLEMDTSILASHGGDFTLTQPKMDTIQKSKRDMSNEETTMAVLQHQSTLLEKDKLIANLWEELQIKEAERLETLKNINAVEESNVKMELVVEECERTITQLGFEKERELGLLMESKEKAAREHEQANEDFKAVDRALKDTVRRYERNKEQIVRMKENENHQKEMVSTVQDRLKREQDRYELLKTDANEKLSSIRSSKEAEILKLKALLKKSELKVTALGDKVDKISKENIELTKMCDELIEKC